MANVIWRGIRRAFRKGPIDTLRWAYFHTYESTRERRFGIETNDCTAWEAGLGNDELHEYQPLSYSAINRAFRHLEVRPGQDSFLDYGCGKGRIMAVAATHAFDRVLGVEPCADLCRFSRENLERMRLRKKCAYTEVAQADATDYDVPADVTVIFLFNPFFGSVLERVLGKIHQSWRKSPRRLQLAYMNPQTHPDLLASCDWLKRTRALPVGRWQTMRFSIYTTG